MLFSFFDPLRFSRLHFMKKGSSHHKQAGPSSSTPTTTYSRASTTITSADSPHTVAPREPNIKSPQLLETPPPSPPQLSHADDLPQEKVRAPTPDFLPEQPTPTCHPILDRLLYTPHGSWAWTKGFPILNTEVLLPLSAGSMCTAAIMRGTIAGQPVKYISRRWNFSNRDQWKGLYSELALYKSLSYLKILQGHSIPHIIGVYVNPISLTIAMELPHSSFWMEASSDMPDALKELCINAMRKIHSCGVVHDDIELRHMLIGADGKVTIIDFQESRALIPLSSVGLAKAEPEELAMELRKVKFKLDYQGARKREYANMSRVQGMSTTGKRREDSRRRHTKLGGKSVTADAPEPVPGIEEWKQRWLTGLDGESKKIVVPGQTVAEVRAAERAFAELVGRLELAGATSQAQHDRNLRATPPHLLKGPTIARACSSARGDTVLGKRRAADDSSSSSPVPTRRPRLLHPSPTLPMAPHAMAPRAIQAPIFPATDPALPPLPPLPPDAQIPFKPSDQYLRGLARTPPPCGRLPLSLDAPQEYPLLTSSSHTESATEELLPASQSKTPPKPIKTFDYVEKPPSGPRGYYFPHPPTEKEVSIYRVIHVRQQNYLQCRQLGLPYYGGNSYRLHTPGNSKPPPGYHVSLGRLKRDRQQEEDHSTGSPRPAKKPRAAWIDAPDWDPSTGYATVTETLDLSGGPCPPRAAAAESRVQTRSHRRSSGGQGILRPTPNVKTVNYERWNWFDEDDFLLPFGAAPERPPSPDEDEENVADFTLTEEKDSTRTVATKTAMDPSSVLAYHRKLAAFSLGISCGGSPGTVASSSSQSAPAPIPITRRPRASPTPSLRKRKRLSASPLSAESYASQATGPFSHLGSPLRGSPASSMRSRATPHPDTQPDVEMDEREEEKAVEEMLRCSDDELEDAAEDNCHALAKYAFSRWL